MGLGSIFLTRGLLMFNSTAIAALVDRYYLETLPSYGLVHVLAFLTSNLALPKM